MSYFLFISVYVPLHKARLSANRESEGAGSGPVCFPLLLFFPSNLYVFETLSRSGQELNFVNVQCCDNYLKVYKSVEIFKVTLVHQCVVLQCFPLFCSCLLDLFFVLLSESLSFYNDSLFLPVSLFIFCVCVTHRSIFSSLSFTLSHTISLSLIFSISLCLSIYDTMTVEIFILLQLKKKLF